MPRPGCDIYQWVHGLISSLMLGVTNDIASLIMMLLDGPGTLRTSIDPMWAQQ